MVHDEAEGRVVGALEERVKSKHDEQRAVMGRDISRDASPWAFLGERDDQRRRRSKKKADQAKKQRLLLEFGRGIMLPRR